MVDADSHLNCFLHPQNTLIKHLSTLICCPLAYSIRLNKMYPHYSVQILWFWVTCGVKMMSLCHGWGWQPTQSTCCIHLRNIQRVWSHLYALHGHTTVAPNSYTHTIWLRFWGSWSLVESKWCHYVLVVADSHLKLLPTYTLDIYKVFKYVDMLSMCIQQQPLTVIPTLIGSDFGVWGHLWSQNDLIT